MDTFINEHRGYRVLHVVELLDFAYRAFPKPAASKRPDSKRNQD